jgi:hypothetical protein
MARALIAGATIVVALALALATPAGATTYQVDGRQKAVDADAGTYKMSGGLIGGWVTTSSEEVATDPYYETKGTEEFRGCLDRRRDGKCGANDPSGTLSFSFHLWALLDPDDPTKLIWGACWHPVTGGTGDFTGAQGVLTFVDWRVGDSVRTKYLGTITTSGGKAVRRTATATAATQTGC